MSANVFQASHRVTYAECTVGNHVYYSRYLDLLEYARGEFFRHLGKTALQWQADDVIFPVLSCRLEYKAAARYDDLLAVEVWPTTAQKVRLNFAYRIRNQENVLLLGAETFHVCAGLNEKPKRLPTELVESLSTWVRPAVFPV